MAKKQTDGSYGAAAHRAITRAQRAAGREGTPELYIAMANAYAMMDLAESLRERRAAAAPEPDAEETSEVTDDTLVVGGDEASDEAASDEAAGDDPRAGESPTAEA